jgi:hypothetical protein
MDKNSRQPPVRIPLDFDTAVSGLLKVDPTGLPKTAAASKAAAKKAAKKKAAKKPAK